MKNKLVLLISLVMGLMIACVSTAFAIGGSTSSTTTFHVHANNGSAYIKLKSSKGVAHVEKHSAWGLNPITGYEDESTYGFYNVTVTGPGLNKTIKWTPSVTFIVDVFRNDFESSSTLEISFPSSGDYTVSVEPMNSSEISSYWVIDRLMYWTTQSTWTVSKEKNCYTDYQVSSNSSGGNSNTVSGGSTGSYTPPTYSGTVYIYCYDENGNTISSSSKTISSSSYIYPPNVSGYTTTSVETYVILDSSTGNCSPSSVNFYYKRNVQPSSSIPKLPSSACTLWLKNSNVERIRPQCGPGYNYAVFASMSGSTKLYNPRNITYMNARFCVGSWVYIEFGYSDGVQRFGFFEKSLFTPSGDWSNVPSYSLSTEKHGRITSTTTPYNGPSTNCGSYASCKLYSGDAVHACMESNGWYLCRFYNGHSNNYGEIYLWVPGSSISWN